MTEESTKSNSQFALLSEAVNFIARCLEAEKVTDLFWELERAQEHMAQSPDYLKYFSEFIFSPLREVHVCQDLRDLYQGRDFPRRDNKFKLGGHMAELGCIHIDFVRQGQGWSLVDISMCR